MKQGGRKGERLRDVTISRASKLSGLHSLIGKGSIYCCNANPKELTTGLLTLFAFHSLARKSTIIRFISSFHNFNLCVSPPVCVLQGYCASRSHNYMKVGELCGLHERSRLVPHWPGEIERCLWAYETAPHHRCLSLRPALRAPSDAFFFVGRTLGVPVRVDG